MLNMFYIKYTYILANFPIFWAEGDLPACKKKKIKLAEARRRDRVPRNGFQIGSARLKSVLIETLIPLWKALGTAKLPCRAAARTCIDRAQRTHRQPPFRQRSDIEYLDSRLSAIPHRNPGFYGSSLATPRVSRWKGRFWISFIRSGRLRRKVETVWLVF